MMEALLITSFAAGMVATVNPCGFAMLPAYLGYFVGASPDTAGSPAVRRALTVSALMSVGFILVFGTAGLLLTLGVRAIIDYLPWLAGLVGAGMVILGIRTFRGSYLALDIGGGKVDRSSVLRFGVSYGLASLSCTLPIFLALIAGTFARSSVIEGVLAFVFYALGMSLVITAITVTITLGQDRLVKLVRNSARFVNKVSGVLLTLAGLFIIWYWATVLSSGAAALGSTPAVRSVDRLSASITGFVADRPLVTAAVLAMVVLGVVAMLRSAHRGRET